MCRNVKLIDMLHAKNLEEGSVRCLQKERNIPDRCFLDSSSLNFLTESEVLPSTTNIKQKHVKQKTITCYIKSIQYGCELIDRYNIEKLYLE